SAAVGFFSAASRKASASISTWPSRSPTVLSVHGVGKARSSSPIPAATADICSAAAARSGRESMAVLLSMGASPPSDRAPHRNSSARPPKNRVGGFSATGESGARRGQERGGRRREARRSEERRVGREGRAERRTVHENNRKI